MQKKYNLLVTAFIISFLWSLWHLLAFLLKDRYDGSMKYLDGSEKTVLGINLGVLGFGIAFLFLILSHVLTKNNLLDSITCDFCH